MAVRQCTGTDCVVRLLLVMYIWHLPCLLVVTAMLPPAGATLRRNVCLPVNGLPEGSKAFNWIWLADRAEMW